MDYDDSFRSRIVYAVKPHSAVVAPYSAECGLISSLFQSRSFHNRHQINEIGSTLLFCTIYNSFKEPDEHHFIMKRTIVLAALLCLIGVSSFAVKPNDSTATNDSAISIATPQDHCPKGYICEATNCSAKGHGKAAFRTLGGISVYKNNGGDVIAYVPRYGHLRCYWLEMKSDSGWYFDADEGRYQIIGYSRK